MREKTGWRVSTVAKTSDTKLKWHKLVQSVSGAPQI